MQFVFGPGATIEAGGFVVIARNPAAFQRRFNVVATGPWTGSLAKSGEKLELRDGRGRVVDEVDYGSGFPWPTAARGAGASMELIHWSLDNSLGGSWRSSRPGEAPQTVYVPGESSGWRFRKGVTEASSPADAWRQSSFLEDATWANGRASIGYGDADDNTELADMRGNYGSLFLRHVFEADPASLPAELVARVRVDDGCILWLNGVEIGRLHMAAGPVAFNSLAQDHEATPIPEDILIPNPRSLLRPGRNVLAAQAFNASLGSSDFTIDVELRTPDQAALAGTPTPGRRNSTETASAPPAIRQVRHSPEQPRPGETVLISAKVTAPGGVKESRLLIQLVEPGAYVRKTAVGYETNWNAITMRDDGLEGDAEAGDGVFSRVLGASYQTHRRLVRYRIEATAANQSRVTVPHADDESPNFAYFVYNGPPDWRGANRPGAAGADGALMVFPASMMTNLPIYHLIANEQDVINSQYNGGFDGVRMWGTLVYDDRAYDHIRFNNRGEASTYVSGKNKWRIHFNRARDFEPRDSWGRKYKEGWRSLNLNGCSSPWSAVNRGMSGLDEAISFRVYELLGVPSPRTHHVHFRVVDQGAEASLSSQYEGDLWGLYLAVEQPDGSFLDERGLPDGNIYKLEGGADKKHQAADQPASSADWSQFSAASAGARTESWWRTNMDVNAYYSFHAANRVVGNIDLREGWNHYFYHRADGRWVPMPWDLDMQFSAKTHWSGTISQKNVLTVAPLRIEFKNRCREVLDLLLSDAATDGGQIGQLIDEYARLVGRQADPSSWAELDRRLWNWHPRTPGNGAANGQGNHRGNFFRSPFVDTRIGGNWTRTLATADLAGFERFLLEYCTDTFPNATWAQNNGNQKGYGYRFLALEAEDPMIPDRPVIAYAGPEGFPVDQLRFKTSAFSDPQGSGTFSAVQWRLGEIAAPWMPGYTAGRPRQYEIEGVWTTGEWAVFQETMHLPAGIATEGKVCRVRCRMQDSTGRWSHWSHPVQFTAGAPGVDRWRRDLSLTEIHYNPAEASPSEAAAGFENDDFEYLELTNLGSEPLDLSNVRFVEGVDAAFSTGTSLPAGASAVLARNTNAFAMRHGSSILVAASFEKDHLRNEGERIRLVYGVNTTLVDFAYQNTPPWPEQANGRGSSLELVDPQTRPDPANPANWRASAGSGGTPGRAFGTTYEQWSARRTELKDPRANADGDEDPNWVEYALGTNPLAANPPPRLTVEGRLKGVDPGAPLVRFRRFAEVSDVEVTPQFSIDLTRWENLGERIKTTPNPDGSVDELWRFAGPLTGSGGFFCRLKLTLKLSAETPAPPAPPDQSRAQ